MADSPYGDLDFQRPQLPAVPIVCCLNFLSTAKSAARAYIYGDIIRLK
jgi:hypothetical protein